MRPRHVPTEIRVRGANVNNLRDLDVDVPLGRYVGMTGVSGSGKSSLALGVLYAEGSRRYLDGLSTYQRRRIEQAAAPSVRSIDAIPAALALHQRPSTPGPRSTVATLSELGAILRLTMSRLGSHPCPNGHLVATTARAWMTERMTCPVDGLEFRMPSAESFSPASLGACPRCEGLGTVTEVDEASLVPDPSKTLAEGAVASWRGTGRRHMPLVAHELGVRTDVPYRDLTAAERDTVLHGDETKRPIVVATKGGRAFEVNAKYENAVLAAELLGTSPRNGGSRTSNQRFLVARTCPACDGTRLNPDARASRLLGRSLPELAGRTLEELTSLGAEIRAAVVASDTDPDRPTVTMRAAADLADEVDRALAPLLALGLEYLQPDRRGDTLSTGERQRMELAATAMRQTTGMLFVLDEPTVGLHPAAVDGLVAVMESIVDTGNSLVVVDHDVAVLRAADLLIELGPGAGADGGRIIAQGTPDQLAADPASATGPYLRAGADPVVRERLGAAAEEMVLSVGDYYNLHDVTATIPRGRLTVFTGVSGAGKSALVIDTLVPALEAQLAGEPLPSQVRALHAPGVRRVVLSDSTPIGANSRSTPATYTKVFDDVREQFAQSSLARERGWTASWFSFNTDGGRCPVCEGLGELALDLQYLPDLPMTCPTCKGRRYTDETLEATVDGMTIADVLSLSVAEARQRWHGTPRTERALRALDDVGLGYLTLGEPTPALSGGEAQRMRLASELRKGHGADVFVFDEPTIGLHPRDVATLVGVLDRLVARGATVVVIEHDLDLVANADWIVDVGPGGGPKGGRIVAAGTVADFVDGVGAAADSTTGPWLRRHLRGN